VSRYVDEHRGRFGVEPICRTLGVSVSAYYQRRSGSHSRRAVEDERLLVRIRELHDTLCRTRFKRRARKASLGSPSRD